MVITYALVALALVSSLVVCAAASPTTERSRTHAADRRRRFVEHHPTHVNSLDIRTLLVREGVCAQQSALVTDKAADRGIGPLTMWLWVEQFGAEAMTVVVAADVSHREMLIHLSNGTAPDHEELRLFASANGLDLAGPVVRTSRRTTTPRRTPLPSIHEPGAWCGLPASGRRLRLDDGAAA